MCKRGGGSSLLGRISAGLNVVDTSALLKLLVREAESAAIERELLTWREFATSVITEVELPRAVARAREERADAVIDGSLVLQGVLSSAAIIPLSEGVAAAARKVKPIHVGALDAIHIASALSLGNQLAGVATYDKRMQDALKPLGVRVIAPEVRAIAPKKAARDAPAVVQPHRLLATTRRPNSRRTIKTRAGDPDQTAFRLTQCHLQDTVSRRRRTIQERAAVTKSAQNKRRVFAERSNSSYVTMRRSGYAVNAASRCRSSKSLGSRPIITAWRGL
jgi:uncharacterized protein